MYSKSPCTVLNTSLCGFKCPCDMFCEWNKNKISEFQDYSSFQAIRDHKIFKCLNDKTLDNKIFPAY